MAVTPQTNTTLEAIAQVLRESDDIVIGGHVGPDGDCIGSQLALLHALTALGKRVVVALAKDEAPDWRLSYLPGFDQLVFAGNYDGPVGAFVAVDVPNRDRLLPAQWSLHEKAAVTVTVDHHAVDTCMAQYSYTDPAAASTSLMAWEIAGFLGAQQVPGVAQCAYNGLMTDTNSFHNSNADSWAFEGASQMIQAGADANLAAVNLYQRRTLQSLKLQAIALDRMVLACDGAFAMTHLTLEDYAQCNATKVDSEGITDLLRSLDGVRVACFLREQDSDIRGSFRAKDQTDVAAIAKKWNGGGHRAAAGFSLQKPMGKALDDVCAAVMKALG